MILEDILFGIADPLIRFKYFSWVIMELLLNGSAPTE